MSGTWYENKYPGCACDVPSHNYTYSFEPNYNWSGVYAKAAEIYEYFDNFAKKHALGRFIKTSHAVVAAEWDEYAGKWNVKVKNEQTGGIIDDSCDILINATGIL